MFCEFQDSKTLREVPREYYICVRCGSELKQTAENDI